MSVLGRFAYSWASDDRPARLHAALNAPEIDVDRIQALAKAMLGDTKFDWPREGTLSLKADRATFAGIDAKRVDVNVRIDANGLGVERLTIADFGGATLAVNGRIDTQSKAPRGAMTVDLDARALDGIAVLAEKFSPQVAAELRRSAERFAPLSLRGSLSVDPTSSGPAETNAVAKFRIDGRAGMFRVTLSGDAEAAGKALAVENLSALSAAKVRLTTRLEAEDARALVELAALDRLVTADKRPGQLTLTANGPLNGQIAIDSQLASGSFSIAAKGTARLAGEAPASAALDVKVANANVRSWRPAAPGKPADVLPASLSARLALGDNVLKFSDLSGTMGLTPVAGSLSIGLAQPMRLDGALEFGAVDLPGVLAAVLGAPPQRAGTNELWPAEPFETGFPGGFTGQIAVKSARVALSPRHTAREARAMLRFAEREISLQDIDGAIAGGRVAGELTFLRRPEGLAARGRIRLAGVGAAELLAGDGGLSGRLTLDVTAEGIGRSAVALMGSLGGSGTLKLEDGRLARLDPGVFEALIRAADQGLPIDAVKVGDWVERALTANALAVPLAEGAISIAAGQARLANTIVRTDKVELAAAGNLNLADGVLDARLVMSGPIGMGGVPNTRPEVVIVLKGPIDAPKRTLDVTALSSWLALRAVEQQSQKLDVLEGRAPAASAGIAPVILPAESAPKPDTSAAGGPRIETEPPPLPRPAVRPQPRPKTEQARPTPGPLDLRQFLFGPRS
jgi:large subunit ribosomal protein L24